MKKTFDTPLTYWEAVTLYELTTKEYCDISDALRSSAAAREVYKDYRRLLQKLEAAIANLHNTEAEG